MQSNDNKKTLTELANGILKKVDQADQLRELAERNPEEASRVNIIIDAFMNPGSNLAEKEKVYEKISKITTLIDANIAIVKQKMTQSYDWLEYNRDNGFVFNIKAKIASTGIIDKKDLQYLNDVYKQHTRLNKIFTES